LGGIPSPPPANTLFLGKNLIYLLLEKAKSQGSFTIVNTVYDFRNEKKDSNQKWPLGKSDDSYHNIDLLIMDCEEALRLSGKPELNLAMDFFQTNGTKAVIITNGSQHIRMYAMKSGSFNEMERSEMPVSDAITRDLTQENKGDTTGCGDNFVGGVIFSVVSQILESRQELDLEEACIWGIVSGGYSCFYAGGTYFEKYPGEKREKLLPYYEQYKRQVNHG
ncbi:MAG: carbohydrate kinase family protein, partial [Cytophagales bacterium]|nr:carbohydrate kinase family protein [Cytophagales bacterium]